MLGMLPGLLHELWSGTLTLPVSLALAFTHAVARLQQ